MNYLALNSLRRVKALVALFALAMLICPAALAQGKQDFTLVNQTGVLISEVYVSPHSAEDWEEDILGQDTLANGDSVDITFSPKERAKLWDLKVVDSKGNSIEWESLNLLEISKVTLHYKNGKAWADLE
jgi:hypothetical protein